MGLRFTSLFAVCGARIVDALVVYLAQPLSSPRAPRAAGKLVLPEVLRRGDVLLTSGNTRGAALVRRATRSAWAHVSMYVGPLDDGEDPPCIVEADMAAGVRAIRFSQLEGQRVQVLRATDLSDADRARLVDWVVSRIGDQYDLATAWALAWRMLRLPRLGRLPSAAEVAEGARRFICSSLVAQAFLLVGQQILPAQARAREPGAMDHRNVTPRDFETASGFQVVQPPTP